ncbi:antibiotic biosynthesis monooxygenase [Cohnella luojiensis]|uniref:Antibiotic biosynthesis monooxygenase n=1 Tax=Cohnella luojiensis TaxID=652876 RepID=A0A4Y8LWP3_9BACL|nr:antibiotic biosynthesis monooxygenase [Cohnella luojiensis]TFE26102.1 antibiotic biosynthesis monooxygenase [Cohnella luojiensis]
MIVAINTIKIKSGNVDEIAERFKNPKGVQHAPGFIRMELLTEAGEEHDELKVCTTWESREAFDGWVNSDAFKQAHPHSRPKPDAAASGGDQPGHGQSHGEQPKPGAGIMLGAKLSVHEVAFTFPG